MAEGEDKLRRLLDVGRSLVSELDPDVVLDRILDEARVATGAKYAALGVLNAERTELGQFLTLGIDDATHAAIGDLPFGRGVLGELIERPQPLRLGDVGHHPQSYGFPPGHPIMRSFLGVPIVIRGQAWGNLYLAEKDSGEEFTDEDEQAAVVLADWAATAIENARLYQSSERRRQQLEQAVRGLEAARDIADAIGGAAELERILELVVKRGRALVEARSVLIMLREGDELVVAAAAGHFDHAPGRRLPVSESTSGQVLETRRPLRIVDVASHLRVAPGDIGVPDARTALLTPMLYHGTADEQLLRTFAASGANAVAISRSVQADRLRSAIEAADQERGRWARELHDQTLQSLGGLRVLLASALRRGDPPGNEDAMRQAIEDIELEIENLRAIISDLRPSLLDDLGLEPAIEALLARRREDGIDIAGRVALGDEDRPMLSKELETTVYRLVQEALTNVVKHAGAAHAEVDVAVDNDELRVEVRDDGRGFEPDSRGAGFGLAGMQERVFLAGGTLDIASSEAGTIVRVRLPVRSHSETLPAQLSA
jgi:signal transduction histidine kinase